MTNPVLVEMVRGDHVESRHRGAFTVVRANGDVLTEVGDVTRAVFPRSSYKMMQALPLVETGAAEAFGLGLPELSLACASHSSESMHTTRVATWLKELELEDANLACGPHESRHIPTRDDMIRAGEKPCRIHNNCSGKHAGFLTVAKHLGASTSNWDYVSMDHPLQKLVTAAISEMCEVEPRNFIQGTDGCAAPNLAMPLKALARGFAKCAEPGKLGATRGAAITRLTEAVRTHPLLMSGTDRACAELIEATGGRAVVKIGAEGVYAGFVPDLGLGFAIKIDDGGTRAVESAVTALLVSLGVLDAANPAVTKWMCPPWRNMNDTVVGEQRVTEELLKPIKT